MASVLEIARLADVSAENVLRVLRGDPVSEDIASRVARAVEVFGPPQLAERDGEVLPHESFVGEELDGLLARFAQTAAALEANLPHDLGTVVYEALRVEVRPVADHIAQLGALFEQFVARMDALQQQVQVERHERLEDTALGVELITSGWRGVDRRLARLEQRLARLEEESEARSRSQVLRFPVGSGPTS